MMVRFSKYLVIMLILLLFTAAKTDRVRTIGLNTLQAMVDKPGNDTLYVVNFWATWCKPCIAELPHFEKASETFAGRKVKVLLISLDFPGEAARVESFVSSRKLKNEVYMLKQGDPNVWLNAIDSSWSGAIPATVYYKNGHKMLFHEGDYSSAELDSVISNNIR